MSRESVFKRIIEGWMGGRKKWEGANVKERIRIMSHMYLKKSEGFGR